MEMQNPQNKINKWEGKAKTTLTKVNADQVWPLFKDFFNLHKWFPTLKTCHGVHGTNGEPGCIRYCSGSSIRSKGGEDHDQVISWSTERLTSVDDVDRTLSYEIVDCNIGFESYVSTVRIVSRDNLDGCGCVIEWTFCVDPVDGMAFEDLVGKYQLGLDIMGKNMEEYVRTNTKSSTL